MTCIVNNMEVLPPKGLFVAALFIDGPVQRYQAFKERHSVVHEDLGVLIDTGDSAFCHSSCFRRRQKMLGQIVFHFASA